MRANVLGDLRAEADGNMLSRAFLETADYRTLIETSDRTVIVGRRGTGKSALTLMLEAHWSHSDDTEVIKITPDEHQTIGVRSQIGLFGDSFTKIRAGARLAWWFALMMETAQCLAARSKFLHTEGYAFLAKRVKRWSEAGRDIADRFRGH